MQRLLSTPCHLSVGHLRLSRLASLPPPPHSQAAGEKAAKQVARKKKIAANRAKRESKNVSQRQCCCCCAPQRAAGGVGTQAASAAAAAPAVSGGGCTLARCSTGLGAGVYLALPFRVPMLQVPNLIFQIEEFERLLIRISKAGEHRLARHDTLHANCRLVSPIHAQPSTARTLHCRHPCRTSWVCSCLQASAT